jgi:hypothetical protein
VAGAGAFFAIEQDPVAGLATDAAMAIPSFGEAPWTHDCTSGVTSIVTKLPDAVTGTLSANGEAMLGGGLNVTPVSLQALVTCEKSKPPPTSTLFTKTVSVAF